MKDQSTLKIFIVYAREDAEALRELQVQFIPVARSERLEVWYDGEILPGQHWDREIKTQLQNADIILLFISKHFFASEYIQTTELKEALARHEAGKSAIVPVIVRPCVWQDAFDVSRFQALPADAKPIFSSHWRHSDEAMVSVVEGVKRVARKLRGDRVEQERLKTIENQRIEKEEPSKKDKAPTKISNIIENETPIPVQTFYEDERWKQLQKLDVKEAYELFIRENPNHPRVIDAAKRIRRKERSMILYLLFPEFL